MSLSTTVPTTPSSPPTAPPVTVPGAADGRMHFSVDGWNPTYGTNLELEDDLGESSAEVVVDIELPAAQWRPIEVDRTVTLPAAALFVDGVRRVEARVWIDEVSDGAPATEASAALCASYAAGVVCCCESQAHLLAIEARRGLFTIAPHALDISTSAGVYHACHTPPSDVAPLTVTLSAALQRRLAKLELAAANAARAELAGHGAAEDRDLLVIDGPLRNRTHLPRTIGFIKSHRSAYLPPKLHAMVGALAGGQRTPVFLMGTTWERYAWYLRLPCSPGSPWAGVVRIECSADLPRAEVTRLANLSQATLCRYASLEYKDARAPQNLYPIAGLERQLRRRLGDTRLLYRALRVAAQ